MTLIVKTDFDFTYTSKHSLILIITKTVAIKSGLPCEAMQSECPSGEGVPQDSRGLWRYGGICAFNLLDMAAVSHLGLSKKAHLDISTLCGTPMSTHTSNVVKIFQSAAKICPQNEI